MPLMHQWISDTRQDHWEVILTGINHTVASQDISEEAKETGCGWRTARSPTPCSTLARWVVTSTGPVSYCNENPHNSITSKLVCALGTGY